MDEVEPMETEEEGGDGDVQIKLDPDVGQLFDSSINGSSIDEPMKSEELINGPMDEPMRNEDYIDGPMRRESLCCHGAHGTEPAVHNCINCYVELDGETGGLGVSEQLCSRRRIDAQGILEIYEITAYEALDIIFSLHSVTNLMDSNSKLCWKCTLLLTQLFKLYIEFSEYSNTPSLLNEVALGNKGLRGHHDVLYGESGASEVKWDKELLDSLYFHSAPSRMLLNWVDREDWNVSHLPRRSPLQLHLDSSSESELEEEEDVTDPALGDKEESSEEKAKKVKKKERRFKCSKCCAAFSSNSKVVRHGAVHSAPNFHCRECRGYFTTSHQLKVHLRVSHGQSQVKSPRRVRKEGEGREGLRIPPKSLPQLTKKPVVVVVSSNEVDEELMSNKVDDSSSLPFHCPHCAASFALHKSIKRHIDASHSTTDLGFNCTICSGMFLNKRKLELHAWRAHKQLQTGKKRRRGIVFGQKIKIKRGGGGENGTNKIKNGPSLKLRTVLKGRVKKKRYAKLSTCPHCSLVLSSTHSLQRHVLRLHKDKPPLQNPTSKTPLPPPPQLFKKHNTTPHTPPPPQLLKKHTPPPPQLANYKKGVNNTTPPPPILSKGGHNTTPPPPQLSNYKKGIYNTPPPPILSKGGGMEATPPPPQLSKIGHIYNSPPPPQLVRGGSPPQKEVKVVLRHVERIEGLDRVGREKNNTHQSKVDVSKLEGLVCPDCGAGFARNRSMRTHFETAHLTSVHFCPYCQVGFSNLVSMRVHLKKMHQLGREEIQAHVKGGFPKDEEGDSNANFEPNGSCSSESGTNSSPEIDCKKSSRGRLLVKSYKYSNVEKESSPSLASKKESSPGLFKNNSDKSSASKNSGKNDKNENNVVDDGSYICEFCSKKFSSTTMSEIRTHRAACRKLQLKNNA